MSLSETPQDGTIAEIDRISKKEEGDDVDEDEDSVESDDEYAEFFQSVRSPTGLEVGIQVTWPNVRPFSIATTLEASEIAPLFHGTQWAGTRIWSAAVVALQYLLLHQENETAIQINDDVSFAIGPDISFLELGCGLGIPGILLHEIVKCPVILTDKDSLLDQLCTNLKQIFETDTDSKLSNGIVAHALDWSETGVQSLLKQTNRSKDGFDIVLNCDCVYEPLYGREAWQSLIACQRALLQTNPNTILITSLERRNADGVERYLEALSKVALKVQQIRNLPFEHDPKVELYVAYGLRK